MNEAKHYPWKDGLPTKPDVDLLMREFADLREGDTIAYEAVAGALGVALPDERNRFRTVTDAWRERLREQGIVVECIRGEAFYVADARGVAALTYGAIKRSGNICRKQRRKLNAVKPRSDDERATIMHHGRLLHEIERTSKTARTNLLPSTAVSPPVAIPPPEHKES